MPNKKQRSEKRAYKIDAKTAYRTGSGKTLMQIFLEEKLRSKKAKGDAHQETA